MLSKCLYTLTGTAPEYVSELCVLVSTQPGRQMLHSAVRNDLVVPCSHTSMHVGFFVFGPSLWNNLSIEIRSVPLLGGFIALSQTFFYLTDSYVHNVSERLLRCDVLYYIT